MFIKENLRTFDLKSLGKFHVIHINVPWEEYYPKFTTKKPDFWNWE